MAPTARRPDQRNRIAADPASKGDTQMEITPAAVAQRHVDEELMEIATAKGCEALRGLEMAKEQPDKDYLTAKAERWQKWAKTAEKQMERKQ